MTNNDLKREWEEQYDKLFGDFPTSGMWYEMVKTFIRSTHQDIFSELEREVKEKMPSDDTLAHGEESDGGYAIAIQDVLSLIQKHKEARG